MPNPDIKLATYVVCFVDLLGVSNSLLGITTAPADPAKQQEIIASIRHSCSLVFSFRSIFRQFLESLQQTMTRPQNIKDEQWTLYNQAKKLDYLVYGLSDAVVIAADIETTDAPCRMIYAAVGACAGTFMQGLLAGFPFRGGIEIGPATPLEKDEIFGPALVNAYTLESTIASFPRIVVGDGLVSYLKYASNQTSQDFWGKINEGLARECLSLINRDPDGRYIVDYISETMKSSVGNEIFKNECQKAYLKVHEYRRSFQLGGRDNIAQKYDAVIEYFDRQKRLWS